MFVATSPSATTPLALRELPSRRLKKHELRVRVAAIGVNPVDWKMREGGPLRLAHRFVGPSGPLVVGVDFAGEVSEHGPGFAGDLPIGARVVGGADFARRQLGSYATEVVVRADQCALLPDNVSFDAAACLPVAGATVWRALVEVGHIDAKPGARVLVLGASGGVGIVALQVARALGATVVGVCSARNVALVGRHADAVIDYGAGDALEAARAHGPFDVVLNAVGTENYPLKGARALLAGKGVVTLIVVRPADVLPMWFLPRVVSVLGRPRRARLQPVVDLMAQGKLECPIEATLPLAEAEQAHVRSRQGKVVGKLLLHP